jgi:hypothetical protein
MILAPLSPSDPRLMNTATATPMDSAPTSAEHRLHRRSREEVEALAKNFIATPAADAPPKVQRRTNLAFAAGGIAVAALLLVILAWPEAESEAQRPAADNSRAAAEAEQWRARYEAERERKRMELKAGSDYMARMAAADAALLKEMTERASKLTTLAAATPEPAPARRGPATTEPTPKDAAPTPRSSTQVASAPVAAEPVKPQPVAARPAPAPAPAQQSDAAAQPTTVAVAAAECKLHVSQLSASGTLTYDAVRSMKGARTISGGAVVLPPVMADGRRVVFTVRPDGCMTWRRA